ncbi:hypothetical protein QWZ04_23150 [Vibrio tapetis subsp. quintayensis]|uniref:hypothetical protein n=1 Tax=Vibrio tapetis TaxID=52443 RepID=UPI0025B2B801|nr:hypothetical protein [Vibrio tapetis]MDN3683208.1 hypothetical protein [Vibrio tapetis subsp. quintayensis]
MFNPVFEPEISSPYMASIQQFIRSITECIVPDNVTVYAYRIGTGFFHVMALDSLVDITITDGHVDIPNKEDCLDSLRVGHIQIGVLDSMDVTCLITYFLNELRVKNPALTDSYLKS